MSERSIGIVCTSPGFGGLELNTLKLAKWFAAKGWQVRMLLNGESPMYRHAFEYTDDHVSLQQVKPGVTKVTAGIIHKWLRADKVPVLFTPYNKDIRALSNYKRYKDRNVKLVYQQQMKIGVNKRDLIHRIRYNMLDVWISPLEYLKNEVLQRTRVPERKIEVIPLGADTKHILDTGITKQAARMTLQLPANVMLLGVLGRIDPKKGQDFVIQALAYLRDRFRREYHLLIMGNITYHEGDKYHSHLRRLVREHGLDQQVHFRSYNEDVNLFYQAIDVFVMPSHGETFGMVTLEAMLSEKPVLGVNRDGTAELLQHGKLGWLHEKGDMEGFCKQLFSLEDNDKIKVLLHDAREEVLEKYAFENCMLQTQTVLEKLI